MEGIARLGKSVGSSTSLVNAIGERTVILTTSVRFVEDLDITKEPVILVETRRVQIGGSLRENSRVEPKEKERRID